MECQTAYHSVALMKALPKTGASGSWPAAAALLEHWLARGERVDQLLEQTAAADRPACQRLFFGAVRHLGRLDAALGALTPRRPRSRLRAILLIAGYELLETIGEADEPAMAARIVDHAVGQAKDLVSAPEARLVNAVLRRFAAAPALHEAAPEANASIAELARYFSHPDWLVRRWQASAGTEAALSLLRWNQTPPPVYGRWRAAEAPPAWMHPAAWPGFYVVPAGRWSDLAPFLAAGSLYLQDPATRAAADLLNPRAGEAVLDLCAAPGGKSLLLADLLAAASRGTPPETARGRVVAVDLPDDRRMDRLEENLAKTCGVDVAVVQADVLALSPEELEKRSLPRSYPAVLLDAPCSNTGVMRHRVDVKWRLHESDIAAHARRQLALLAAAARLVAGPAETAAGAGRIVYSTCSLEPEENEAVVDAFLRSQEGRFSLQETRLCRPWADGCDGASAFLLRREAP